MSQQNSAPNGKPNPQGASGPLPPPSSLPSNPGPSSSPPPSTQADICPLLPVPTPPNPISATTATGDKDATACPGRPNKRKSKSAAPKAKKAKTQKDTSHLHDNGMRPPTKASRRQFSADDELALIDFWEENYAKYCNTTRMKFAKEAADYLNVQFFPSTPNRIMCTPVQVKGKLETLAKSYKNIRDHYNGSGIGLEAMQGSDIRLHVERKMRHFYRVNRFLSTRSNMVPPVLSQAVRRQGNTKSVVKQSGAEVVDDDLEILDLVEDELEEEDKIATVAASSGRRGRRASTGSISVPKESPSASRAERSGSGRPESQRLREDHLAKLAEASQSLDALNKKQSDDTISVMQRDVGLREEELEVLKKQTTVLERQVNFKEKAYEAERRMAKAREMRETAMTYKNLGMQKEAKEMLEKVKDLLEQ